jgi:type IV pilus assembly protein PilM
MGKSLITGIDIGHYSIKAVVVKPVSDDFLLVSFKELPVSSGLFSDNHTVDYQEIVKKLKELRKVLPLFSRRMAMTIPDGAVISKVLQVERELEESEIEFAIYHAFSHQSPFPMEELCLDFVKSSDDTKTPTVEYQVYAAKREVLDSRLMAAESVGFDPVVCDLHTHSLVRVWQLAAVQRGCNDWLLVDIGLTRTLLCMDFINRVPFTKEIALGTQSIEQALSAPQSLFESGRDEFIQRIVEHLRQQIQWLLSTKELSSIRGVWLCGGGASTATLVEEIEYRLKIECQILNPLDLLEHTPRNTINQPHSPNSFSSALGIAIRASDWLKHAQ